MVDAAIFALRGDPCLYIPPLISSWVIDDTKPWHRIKSTHRTSGFDGLPLITGFWEDSVEVSVLSESKELVLTH
jgi:hypothetical protein